LNKDLDFSFHCTDNTGVTIIKSSTRLLWRKIRFEFRILSLNQTRVVLDQI